jgi:hypothetical protein
MYRPPVHCGVMSDTVIEERTTNPKGDEWAERIAEQRRSGMSVKQFCKEQRLTEYSFYRWRKRLQDAFGRCDSSIRRHMPTMLGTLPK